MYRGATRINLDGKNRIAIPTKYREKILIESSGLLVLTAHIYKCLLLYPPVCMGADSRKNNESIKL
jgi:MraZ protein